MLMLFPFYLRVRRTRSNYFSLCNFLEIIVKKCFYIFLIRIYQSLAFFSQSLSFFNIISFFDYRSKT